MVDVGTHRLHALTPPQMDVESYDVAGGDVIYLGSTTPGRRRASASSKLVPEEDQATVTGTPFYDILNPNDETLLRSYDLYTISKLQVKHLCYGHQLVAQANRVLSDPLSVSPDGRSAIILRATSLQESNFVKPEDVDSKLSFMLEPPRTYQLVNLHTGAVNALGIADGRYLYRPGRAFATWSQDGGTVVITNTLLIANDRPSITRAEAARPCEAALLQLFNSAITCLDEFENPSGKRKLSPVTDVAFSNGGTLLTLRRSANAVETFSYNVEAGHWSRSFSAEDDTQTRLVDAALTSPILKVKEGLNEPEALWGESPTTKRLKELWDPNPQMSTLRFGNASVYSWKDDTGYVWNGVLIKPVGYIPGKLYPLVIQTHGYSKDQFITDGAFPTAMAARAMASSGIMVLQMGGRFDHLDQQEEAIDNVRGYTSAIGQLSSDNLIDSKRVGVIGFSRTCWYVETALVQHPYLFAAATLADGADMSYMQYMLYSPDDSTVRDELEKIVGSPAFGAGLKHWVEASPSYHLDAIRTPVRIEAIHYESILTEWEIYASLRIQHKPVDLIYFPDDRHVLQKPVNRLLSEQGAVDWYRFWLLDQPNPNALESVQYRHWMAMKQNAVHISP